MTIDIRRRKFITLLGGAAVVSSSPWPRAAYAQPGERMPRIAVLARGDGGGPAQKANLAGLGEGCAKFGWAAGKNLRIDVRFAVGGLDTILARATELVGLEPKVIVVLGDTVATLTLQRQTKSIP